MTRSHPAIHYLSSFVSSGGVEVCWCQCPWGEAGSKLWTLGDNSESSVSLKRGVFVCGRKQKYPEKTQADMGRTCRFHTEGSDQDLNEGPARAGIF